MPVLRREFAALKPAEFEKCLLSWITALHEISDGQLVAIDGKTLRRSFDAASSKAPIHMVSAWATANCISLGQVVVDADRIAIRNEGRILSHESLLTKIWGDSYVDARDLLRVHIQHLRQKLEDSAESPSIIVTEHGIGYKFIRPSGN